MQSILIGILVAMVKRLVTSKLFDYIKSLVLSQVDKDLTGEEKRASVKESLAGVKSVLGDEAKKTGSLLINLAIETAVLAIRK